MDLVGTDASAIRRASCAPADATRSALSLCIISQGIATSTPAKEPANPLLLDTPPICECKASSNAVRPGINTLMAGPPRDVSRPCGSSWQPDSGLTGTLTGDCWVSGPQPEDKNPSPSVPSAPRPVAEAALHMADSLEYGGDSASRVSVSRPVSPLLSPSWLSPAPAAAATRMQGLTAAIAATANAAATPASPPSFTMEDPAQQLVHIEPLAVAQLAVLLSRSDTDSAVAAWPFLGPPALVEVDSLGIPCRLPPLHTRHPRHRTCLSGYAPQPERAPTPAAAASARALLLETTVGTLHIGPREPLLLAADRADAGEPNPLAPGPGAAAPGGGGDRAGAMLASSQQSTYQPVAVAVDGSGGTPMDASSEGLPSLFDPSMMRAYELFCGNGAAGAERAGDRHGAASAGDQLHGAAVEAQRMLRLVERGGPGSRSVSSVVVMSQLPARRVGLAPGGGEGEGAPKPCGRGGPAGGLVAGRLQNMSAVDGASGNIIKMSAANEGIGDGRTDVEVAEGDTGASYASRGGGVAFAASEPAEEAAKQLLVALPTATTHVQELEVGRGAEDVRGKKGPRSGLASSLLRCFGMP